MARHAQANGLALGMAHSAWHFFGGFQNEGESAGCGLLQHSELSVVHFGIVGQLTQVAAQNSKVMFVINSAHFAQMIGRSLVVHVADQRITGIGGHGQHATLVEQGHCLFEQALLGVLGVNRKILGHVNSNVQDSMGKTWMRLSRTVNQAPNAPHRVTTPMPTKVHWSGMWSKTHQPPSMANPICV